MYFLNVYWKFVPTPSFLCFLPFPFLTCCEILLTSFEDGTPFEAMTGRTVFLLLAEVFRFFFFSSAVRQMSGDLCTDPGIISLSIISLADRRDWRDTQSKWSLAWNPDRSWWRRYQFFAIIFKLFFFLVLKLFYFPFYFSE